jgi:hypothetical protein
MIQQQTPPVDVVLMQQYSAGFNQGKLRGAQEISQAINARHVSMYVGVAVFSILMIALVIALGYALQSSRTDISKVHEELLVIGSLRTNLSERELNIAAREAQQDIKDKTVDENRIDSQELHALDVELGKCRSAYAAISDMMKRAMSEPSKTDTFNEYSW